MRRLISLIFISLLLVSARPACAASLQDLTVQTRLGPYKFEVELAQTPAERELGLMYRRSLDPDHGMLFVFDHQQPVSMWMKNTEIPLDMLFLRPDGTIATIRENAVPESLDVISSGEPVSAVVELSGGTVAKLKIAPGDRVTTKGVGGNS